MLSDRCQLVIQPYGQKQQQQQQRQEEAYPPSEPKQKTHKQTAADPSLDFLLSLQLLLLAEN